jgi:TolA-binding protein
MDNSMGARLVGRFGFGTRSLGLAAAGLSLAFGAMPAAAQSDSEVRLKKVEAEVRALQRKVFPDGAGKTFEPEITGAQSVTPQVGAPSTTAVTDILARLDALEGQLRQLTAGNEENANALRLLQDRVKLLETAGSPAVPVLQPAPSASTQGPSTTSGAVRTPVSATTTTATPQRTAGPSAERLAAVQAIAKPDTGDAGADEYAYGFRLWEAKFYPEAVQQLTMFVDKHPRHAQISYGRNLLGRAYLDDGKAREAAPWFLQNYQTDKSGARAGDSLLYLAESMIALKDTKRACIALAEFAEEYPALASGRLKAQFDAGRSKAKCS